MDQMTVAPPRLAAIFIFQFLIYMERALVPAFSYRIVESIIASGHGSRQDSYLSALYAALFGGLAIAAPIVALAAQQISIFGLVIAGMTLWSIMNAISGFFGLMEMFPWMIASRAIAGVGQAIFVGVAPAILNKYCDKWSGRALGTLHAMLPIGTAAGFGFAAMWNARNLPWQYGIVLASFLGLIVSLTLWSFMFRCWRIPEAHLYYENNAANNSQIPSVWRSIGQHALWLRAAFNDISNWTFIATIVGQAGLAGACAILSLYGVAVSVEWDVSRSEAVSQLIIGIIVSINGALGTVLGGWMADRPKWLDQSETTVLSKSSNQYNHNKTEIIKNSNRCEFIGKLLFISSIIAIATFSLSPLIVLGNKFSDNYKIRNIEIQLYQRLLFLGLLCIGVLAMFVCQPLLSMVQLFAVDPNYQAIALPLALLFAHVFGDVPSLIIAGVAADEYSARGGRAYGLFISWLIAIVWLSSLTLSSIVIWIQARTIQKKYQLYSTNKVPAAIQFETQTMEFITRNEQIVTSTVNTFVAPILSSFPTPPPLSQARSVTDNHGDNHHNGNNCEIRNVEPLFN